MNANSDLKAFDRPSRKIGRDHLAFFLGYLEGVPIETLSRTYLDSEYSGIKIKNPIHWLQDEFPSLIVLWMRWLITWKNAAGVVTPVIGQKRDRCWQL